MEVSSETGPQFGKYKNMILSLSSDTVLLQGIYSCNLKSSHGFINLNTNLLKREKNVSQRLENLSLLVRTFLFSVFKSQGNLISN